MSRTSLLQHIRKTAEDRKAKRGTVNAEATVPPEQPKQPDPTASALGGWRAAPYFEDTECRFENLAPLESSRQRLLDIVNDAERLKGFAQATEPQTPKPASPRRSR